MYIKSPALAEISALWVLLVEYEIGVLGFDALYL